jgi:hypothetical protein
LQGLDGFASGIFPAREEHLDVPVGLFSASAEMALEEMEFILAAHFLRESL